MQVFTNIRHPSFLELVLFIGLLIPSLLLAADTVSFKTYVTNEKIGNQPSTAKITEFDCSDRIFLVVEAAGLAREKHSLTVKWINPVNNQQELTHYDFQAHSFSRVWAWLQLHGPTGAVIGQIFDPSFGMEDFIGEWHALVSIDNKQIDNILFNVVC